MPYFPKAVTFDGNSALSIASLACTDNDFISFATWLKINAARWTQTQTVWVTDSENNFTNCWFPTAGQSSRFFTADASDANQLNMQTTGGAIPFNQWVFFIGSANTNTGKIDIQMGLNGTPGLTDIYAGTIKNNSPFAMSNNGKSFWFMGDSLGAGDYIEACASDTSFWQGTSFLNGSGVIDPTIAAYFFDGSGFPVAPSTAIAHLGTPPILFAGDMTSFATNQGSGGAFTVNGDPLTNCTNAPGPPQIPNPPITVAPQVGSVPVFFFPKRV